MAMEFEHESFAQQEDSVHNKIEELLATLIAVVTGARAKELPDPVTSWSLPPSVTQAPMGVNPFTVPCLRLEPPRFEGQNVAEWIRRMQIYYNHHYTPLSDRLYLTQYLFDPLVSDWMADWTGNNPDKGWEDFLVVVYHHFTPEFLDGDSHMVDDVHQYETIVDAPNEVTLGSSIPDAALVFCSIEDVSCDTISDEYNIGVDTTMGRHILGEIQPGDFADIEAVEHHHSARGLKVEELSIVVDLRVVQGIK